ncbi:transcriptional activator hap2 [Nannochloropsis gaditana]|uniref:Nuclear transcription factor Y subunit n=1 Tax=Nannochloropsis gaditana TaxID=72520 RepID=W7TNQ8_9STRA|nr:transcriptional activator hap2 [Nannochloropsis gaditana]
MDGAETGSVGDSDSGGGRKKIVRPCSSAETSLSMDVTATSYQGTNFNHMLSHGAPASAMVETHDGEGSLCPFPFQPPPHQQHNLQYQQPQEHQMQQTYYGQMNDDGNNFYDHSPQMEGFEPLGAPQEAAGSDLGPQPIFVNPKQYERIMKRREARARLENHRKIAAERKPFLHKSRHLHAVKRPRGPGGRFLTKEERIAWDEEQAQLEGTSTMGAVHVSNEIAALPHVKCLTRRARALACTGSMSDDCSLLVHSNAYRPNVIRCSPVRAAEGVYKTHVNEGKERAAIVTCCAPCTPPVRVNVWQGSIS